jgi:hypothetical protein
MEDSGRDDGTKAALECARRCLEAALEQTDHKTTAALLRAAARYFERTGAEKGPGDVVAFPAPARVWGMPLEATRAIG